ncbi:DUF1750-domain-containing protein [Setomelanomma holmii]|uniref:DUF1750-domain-containing protein n=1 Tax=Setomelanomma holmii TaxID=210430 RepID=A0A9P4HA31_9PLEO|nr:DUF1750-domain-containing protein [Setomelanomma holmii]
MYGMNQAYNVPDPSAQVPNHLLAHVHLISSYRFPTTRSLQPAEALEHLIKGPQIVRDTSPVVWTYFTSPPPDGTVVLTWQPPRMQTHFASDGMVWADPETAYDMNIRGYTLQVLVHNSGYHYPHEAYAMHARFRYRIAAGPGATDPNLWLVHYKPADPQHRMPAGQIPIPREIHAQLHARSQLQAAGPLMRKEFMLHDQANWPKVEFGQQAMRGPQPYYNPMQPGRPPYPTQQPPNKRQKLPNQPPARAAITGINPQDASLEDEENATQDAFDFLTPREISLSRYKQHHEWMEEIFSSPYAVGKIAPIDLGLGLMGELAPLTAGILDVPGVDASEGGKEKIIKNYYKLDPEQLKIFEKRVAEYTSTEQAEIDKMKTDHAKKIAQLKRTRTYIKAERRLRDVSRSAENEIDESDPVEEVVQDLEKSLGVSFDAKKSVVCVEKGGFIEAQQPSPPPAQVNGNGVHHANGSSNGISNDGALEADNSAAGLLDQYGSGSLTGTPIGNISLPPLSQPPSQSHSAIGTPSAPSNLLQSSAFNQQGASLDAGTGDDLLDLDVEMSGMTNAGDKGDEWVLVDEQAGGEQPGGNPQQTSTSNNPTTQNTMAPANVDAEAGSMFDTADFGSFDNLDTAGDALAEYDNDDTMGLDLVDDSAFGDAFHATEMHHDETGDGDHA